MYVDIITKFLINQKIFELRGYKTLALNFRNKKKGEKMEKAYEFLQLTLLGLIVGIIIILLTQFNYWAYDIKMTIRKSVVYQNNEKVRQLLEENKKQPPTCTIPNAPRHKI